MPSTYFSNSAPGLGNVSIFGASTTPYGNVILGGGTTYSLTTATSYSNGIFNNTSSGAIHIKGDAEFEGKIKINGQDLVETLHSIQRRLSILVPDPKLLDKYEALQQAYEHYKTLEALCIDENNSSK